MSKLHSLDMISAGPMLKTTERMIYALDADELTMLEPFERLSADQLAKEEEYVKEMSAYGLSVLAITDPEDTIVLNRAFLQCPELLSWLQAAYRRIGLDPTKNIVYAEPKSFYATAFDVASKFGYRKISATSFSHFLDETFPLGAVFETSKRLNKKTNLPSLSEAYRFGIPRSLVAEAVEKSQRDLVAFFNTDDYPLFVKADGLGGGANVSKVETADRIAVLRNDRRKLLIQAHAPARTREVSTTFVNDAREARLLNTRAKLSDDGGTYGSVFHPRLHPSDRWLEHVHRAAEGARCEGYESEDPLLIGFDSFVGGDAFFVTEINARWLGSTRYDLFLKKLNLLGNVPAVAITDRVHSSELEKYQRLVETYLLGTGRAAFELVPVAFSAYVGEDGLRAVSYMVIGSFEEFFQTARREFSRQSLPLLQTSLGLHRDITAFFRL